MGCKKLNTDFFNFLEVVHSKKSASEEKKRINYYPFGLQHKGYNNTISSNGNSTAQKFGYNGKELNEELGLEWHDFGARNYDAALGRWFNIDNLAEKFNPISPYVYTLNNPIIFADPDGNDVILKIAGERMEGYKKFVSTNAGRAFVSQFLKKDDMIPGTNIKIQESGKYANETLSFVTAKVNKGKAGVFYKNGKNSRTAKNNVRNVNSTRDLQDPNSNFEFAVFLEKSDQIKSDEYAVIIGHESFVHHSESLDKLDNIRDKTKNGGYKNALQLLEDIIDLGSGADKDHAKLSKDQVKLFINMVNELDGKEGTNKYTKMYEENRDQNKKKEGKGKGGRSKIIKW